MDLLGFKMKSFPSSEGKCPAFAHFSSREESLTVTNRAVELLVEKSGLADVPLRESLMLVWGRRFSCDVATGMIPLGDLRLGDGNLNRKMGGNRMTH